MIRPFLTAEWRYLILFNFSVDGRLLAPYVPRGTTLDTCGGDTWVSLVGFRFLNTRVRGVPIPGHQHFPEVNLRFYVRDTAHGRRGVVFLKEIVPRRAVTIVARTVYHEPYVTRRMRAGGPMIPTDQPGRVTYAWWRAGRWHEFGVTVAGPVAPVPNDTDSAFLIDHNWGYTRQPDGSTAEYAVEHPRWRSWPVRDVTFDVDPTAEYDPALAEVMRVGPTSVILAEGSAVAVSRASLLV